MGFDYEAKGARGLGYLGLREFRKSFHVDEVTMEGSKLERNMERHYKV